MIMAGRLYKLSENCRNNDIRIKQKAKTINIIDRYHHGTKYVSIGTLHFDR